MPWDTSAFQYFPDAQTCWDWNIASTDSVSLEPLVTSLAHQKNIVLEYSDSWAPYQTEMESLFQPILLPQDQFIIHSTSQEFNQSIFSQCVPTIWFRPSHTTTSSTLDSTFNTQMILYNDSLNWIYMPNIVMEVLMFSDTVTPITQTHEYTCFRIVPYVLCLSDSDISIPSYTQNCTQLSSTWSLDLSNAIWFSPVMEPSDELQWMSWGLPIAALGIVGLGFAIGRLTRPVLQTTKDEDHDAIDTDSRYRDILSNSKEEEDADEPVVVARSSSSTPQALITQWH